MQHSGWQKILLFPAQCAARPLLALLVLLLAACAAKHQGVSCSAERETLSGQPLGSAEGKVIDDINAFSVWLPEISLNSGPLHSNDPQRYIPSAVTAEGWLAQRLSSQRFSVINAPQNLVITLTCPPPGT